jgi:hypothetical protein
MKKSDILLHVRAMASMHGSFPEGRGAFFVETKRSGGLTIPVLYGNAWKEGRNLISLVSVSLQARSSSAGSGLSNLVIRHSSLRQCLKNR